MEIILRVKLPIKFTVGKVLILIKRTRHTLLDWEKKGFIPPSRREASSRYRYWSKEEVQKIIDFSAL